MSQSKADNLISDGRRLRSAKTRAAIVDATLEILREGNYRPSAEEIGLRAGVSYRAIFHHFSNMESIYQLLAEATFKEGFAALTPALLLEGKLAERITVFVERRSRFLELMTPLKKALLLQEPLSAKLKKSITLIRQQKRAEVGKVFKKELALSKDKLLLDKVAMVSSWNAWNSFRHQAGFSMKKSKLLMEEIVGQLLDIKL